MLRPLKFLMAVDLAEVLEFSLGSPLKQVLLKDSPQISSHTQVQQESDSKILDHNWSFKHIFSWVFLEKSQPRDLTAKTMKKYSQKASVDSIFCM